MTKKTSSTQEPVVVNPLPVDAASAEAAGQPPAPSEAPVRKKTNFDRVFEKLDEIDAMAAHGRPELRDTIRARSAEIRDILS